MDSVLTIHWKDWCWNWNSNNLSTWGEELTHWTRPWCWERLKVGGEGGDRGWGGWMASLTQWTWVWVNSGSWWWTGRPGVLQSMGLQRVRHGWATELNRHVGWRWCHNEWWGGTDFHLQNFNLYTLKLKTQQNIWDGFWKEKARYLLTQSQGSPTLQADSLPAELSEKPIKCRTKAH